MTILLGFNTYYLSPSDINLLKRVFNFLLKNGSAEWTKDNADEEKLYDIHCEILYLRRMLKHADISNYLFENIFIFSETPKYYFAEYKTISDRLKAIFNCIDARVYRCDKCHTEITDEGVTICPICGTIRTVTIYMYVHINLKYTSILTEPKITELFYLDCTNIKFKEYLSKETLSYIENSLQPKEIKDAQSGTKEYEISNAICERLNSELNKIGYKFIVRKINHS